MGAAGPGGCRVPAGNRAGSVGPGGFGEALPECDGTSGRGSHFSSHVTGYAPVTRPAEMILPSGSGSAAVATRQRGTK